MRRPSSLDYLPVITSGLQVTYKTLQFEYAYNRPDMVSKAEIDRIYDMDKVIETDWEWRPRGRNIEGEATVYCLNEDITLTLKAWKRRNYGFCLLYKTSKIVRRWDTSVPHTNPDGEVITDPHKHFWTEEHEDAFAYPVEGVPTDDVHAAFWDFLEECNIELRGTYQTGLHDHD